MTVSFWLQMDLTTRFRDVAILETILYPHLETNILYPIVRVQALYSSGWPQIIVPNPLYSFACTPCVVADLNTGARHIFYFTENELRQSKLFLFWIRKVVISDMYLGQTISTVATSTAVGNHAMALNKPYPIIRASGSFGSHIVLVFS
jgi:hypothetical protein